MRVTRRPFKVTSFMAEDAVTSHCRQPSNGVDGFLPLNVVLCSPAIIANQSPFTVAAGADRAGATHTEPSGSASTRLKHRTSRGRERNPAISLRVCRRTTSGQDNDRMLYSVETSGPITG